MIDDHTYRRNREKLLHGWWHDTRAVLAGGVALLLLIAQILTLIVTWHH